MINHVHSLFYELSDDDSTSDSEQSYGLQTLFYESSEASGSPALQDLADEEAAESYDRLHYLTEAGQLLSDDDSDFAWDPDGSYWDFKDHRSSSPDPLDPRLAPGGEWYDAGWYAKYGQ